MPEDLRLLRPFRFRVDGLGRSFRDAIHEEVLKLVLFAHYNELVAVDIIAVGISIVSVDKRSDVGRSIVDGEAWNSPDFEALVGERISVTASFDRPDPGISGGDGSLQVQNVSEERAGLSRGTDDLTFKAPTVPDGDLQIVFGACLEGELSLGNIMKLNRGG